MGSTSPVGSDVARNGLSVVVIHRLANKVCFKRHNANIRGNRRCTCSARGCAISRVGEVTGATFRVTVGEDGGLADISGTGILSSSEL